MSRVPCRKLTLADLMVLVGSSAVGLEGARRILPTIGGRWWSAYPMGAGSPVLASLTIAMLMLRLQKPRPVLRRLFRQPGASACLAASSTFSVWAIVSSVGGFRPNQGPGPVESLAFSGSTVGAAVLGAWLVLLVTRSGRVEPGWIDRSGIALGVGWIGLMLVVLGNDFLL